MGFTPDDPGHGLSPARADARRRRGGALAAALLVSLGAGFLVAPADGQVIDPLRRRADPPVREAERDRLERIREIQPGGVIRQLPRRMFVRPRSSLIPNDEVIAAAEVTPEAEAIVTALGSDEWAERAEATRALAAGRVPLAVLLRVLERDDLDGEVRHRLIAAVCARIETAPRGALGIRMLPANDGRPGIVVQGFVPGLPAERVLEMGDRIVEIEGRSISRNDEVIGLVQSQEPGDSVRLKIERILRDDRGSVIVDEDGAPRTREIEVDFELGSADLLDSDTSGAARPRISLERSDAMEEVRERHRPTRGLVTLTADPARDARFADLPIETDPRLSELLRQLSSPSIDVAAVRNRLRANARQVLAEIEREAADASRGPNELAWLRRVADAYRQRMPADWR